MPARRPACSPACLLCLLTASTPRRQDLPAASDSAAHNPNLLALNCLQPSAVVDLTVNLDTATSYDEVMAELKRASQEELSGILG